MSTAPISATTPPRRRSRWRRRIGCSVLILVLLASVPVGYWLYQRHAAQMELEAALAEVDRIDPGWRLKDLEAKRESLPDEDNAGRIVTAAAGLLPKRWHDEKLEDELETLPPPTRLSPAQATVLRTLLKPLGPALAEAHKLRDKRKGRYYVQWAPNYLDTLFPHQEFVRNVCYLLVLDAVERSDAGDIRGALDASVAAIHSASSIGDEPVLISYLVRVAARGMAIASLQRTLAQGQAATNDLARLQKALEEEAAEQPFVAAVRGERIFIHDRFSRAEDGTIPRQQLGVVPPTGSAWKDKLSDMLTGDIKVREAHTRALRLLTEMVEIAKKPLQEHPALLRKLQAYDAEDPSPALLFLPAIIRVAEVNLRSQAQMQCAIAGLAIERYRLAQGHWPENLDTVKAANLLKTVPLDPFDGSPLRFRSTRDGVVVYSVGLKGDLRGDALDKIAAAKPDDLWPGAEEQERVRLAPLHEFRLWNVDRRHQPAAPQVLAPPRPLND